MNKNVSLIIFLIISNTLLYAQEPTNFVGSFVVKEVVADLETSPVISNDDAADDICIYENVDSPESSVIIGTDKKYGLVIYNLDGQIINHYPFGRVNNVDIINKFSFKGDVFPLICGSNRSTNSIELYKLNPKDNSLEIILNSNNKSSLKDVYGITFYQGDNSNYIFVSDKESGNVEQWIVDDSENSLSIKKIRTIKFRTLIEGLVADEYYGKIYIAEENKGLWQINADPNIAENRRLIFGVNKIFKKRF
jgi:3-phytase